MEYAWENYSNKYIYQRQNDWELKIEHLYVSPSVRIDSFLHWALHLVNQSLTHAGCSEEQKLVWLEAFLYVASGVGDPQSDQRIELCKRKTP